MRKQRNFSIQKQEIKQILRKIYKCPRWLMLTEIKQSVLWVSSAKVPSSDVRARKIEFESSVQSWECLFGLLDLDIHCGQFI